MNCVFCGIVSGKVPAEVVYSGDRVLGFLDVSPIHPGHCLLIPKVHVPDLLQLPDEVAGEMMRASRLLASGMTQALGLEGFNLFSNNGEIAGQSVFHFHIHITPRYPGDQIRFVHGTRRYEPGEMRSIGGKIRAAIGKN